MNIPQGPKPGDLAGAAQKTLTSVAEKAQEKTQAAKETLASGAAPIADAFARESKTAFASLMGSHSGIAAAHDPLAQAREDAEGAMGSELAGDARTTAAQFIMGDDAAMRSANRLGNKIAGTHEPESEEGRLGAKIGGTVGYYAGGAAGAVVGGAIALTAGTNPDSILYRKTGEVGAEAGGKIGGAVGGEEGERDGRAAGEVVGTLAPAFVPGVPVGAAAGLGSRVGESIGSGAGEAAGGRIGDAIHDAKAKTGE